MTETKMSLEKLDMKSAVAQCLNVAEDAIKGIEPYYDDIAQKEYIKITTEHQIFIVWIGVKLVRASKKVKL